jgi:hypothetical protein
LSRAKNGQRKHNNWLKGSKRIESEKREKRGIHSMLSFLLSFLFV